MKHIFLGFDVGGTKSAVLLGDDRGSVLDRIQCDTGEPDPTVDRMIADAQSLCRKHGVTPAAAGVSVGSPLDRRRGLICAPPNMPRWVDVPICRRIAETFRVPVNIENDADASALAEWRWGFERAIDDVIYLTCGTGQGAGLIIGGRLHRGISNMAGEIGHVRLRPDGPVGCNKAGSVEGHTSGKALGLLTQRRLASPHPASSLDAVERDRVTGRHVGEAATAGDALAIEIVRELGGYLGEACAILIDILNPQRISLGSLAIRLGDMLLDPVREAAKREAHVPSYAACTIAPAALGDRIQDLAALAAADLALTDPAG